MAVTNPIPEKGTDTTGTDPRDRNILLGIDSEGVHHIYQTRSERIVVVNPEFGMTYIQDLGAKTVDDWVDHVTAKRGWDDKRYGVSLAEMVAPFFEEEA